MPIVSLFFCIKKKKKFKVLQLVHKSAPIQAKMAMDVRASLSYSVCSPNHWFKTSQETLPFTAKALFCLGLILLWKSSTETEKAADSERGFVGFFGMKVFVFVSGHCVCRGRRKLHWVPEPGRLHKGIVILLVLLLQTTMTDCYSLYNFKKFVTKIGFWSFVVKCY